MDEADVERIKALAAERGLSLGKLIRDTVLGRSEALSSPAPPDLLSQLDAVKIEFARQLRAHDERLKALEAKPRSEPEAKRTPSEPKRQRVPNPQGFNPARSLR